MREHEQARSEPGPVVVLGRPTARKAVAALQSRVCANQSAPQPDHHHAEEAFVTIQRALPDISSVLLPGGWHRARDFSTGESPFGDGATWFSFTDILEGGETGSLLAGPDTAIQSVAVPRSLQPQQSQAEEIARLLKGRVEDETVHFEFDEMAFELWHEPGHPGWSHGPPG
ncbi:hypothetical protein ACFQ78_28355 [Streptomyces sp. NPDC056519]|uniref:hypothetical protein n=1 Tax=Streptomyces sp. NPDC056519 TaxID=3345849 RepID=UPI0036ADF148